MKDTYEVGYRKPPKATRFGNRPQPDRSAKPASARDAAVDVAATINGLMKVSQRGAIIHVHPHQAMMLGLAKRGLDGSIRAIREFFLECKKAGLLEAPPSVQTGGSIFAPKGVPCELACRLVRMVGLPPWPEDVYADAKAEYDADCAHIEQLTALEEAKLNEKGQ